MATTNTTPYICTVPDVAAYLMCRGFEVELVRIGTRHEFHFKDPAAAQEAVAYHRNAMVVAREYAQEMRALKAMIRDSLQTTHNEVPRYDPRQPK